MESSTYSILILQLSVLIFIIWVTGRSAMFTCLVWHAKVYFLYYLDCTKCIIEDTYFRSRQRVIDCSDKTGCVAVVTGGGRGLGYHVVRGLVERGMHVVVGVRNPENYNSMGEVFQKEGLKGAVEVLTLDTSSMQSVREFARAVRSAHPAIHVLVNNAAQVFGGYEETDDGFETKLATNYLGHFLLTHHLVGCLERGGRDRGENSRVVNVSSSVHSVVGDIQLADLNMVQCYSRIGGYAHSKLAQLMFSRHLNRLLSLRVLPISSSALHPGVVASNMTQDWKDSVLALVVKLLKTEAEGALSVLYCALDRATEPGADFISNMREWGTSARSKDVDKQRQLFELTCEMLHIKSFGSKADI